MGGDRGKKQGLSWGKKGGLHVRFTLKTRRLPATLRERDTEIKRTQGRGSLNELVN